MSSDCFKLSSETPASPPALLDIADSCIATSTVGHCRLLYRHQALLVIADDPDEPPAVGEEVPFP